MLQSATKFSGAKPARSSRSANPLNGADSPKRFSPLLAVFLTWVSVTNSVFGGGATRVVTNLDDGGPGSLREEIAIAQADDTISFAVHGTIVLTNGELLIDKNLKIAGPGATNLAVSARSQGRVLEIYSKNTAVGIFGLTICDGRAPDGAAGTSNNPAGGNGSDGGGIYNAGSLTMAQCVVSNCAAGDGGPGFSTGAISTPDATNWAGGVGGRGGAIYNSGKLLLAGSTLVSNSSGTAGNAGSAGRYVAAGSAGGGGGAIYNAGMMTLTASAFERNAAGNGGGAGSGLVWGSSFDGGESGGSGGNGGALYDAGQAATSISDCQFNFNASGSGGMGATTSPISLPSLPVLGGPGGTGGGGGAIWAEEPVSIKNCTFVSNQTGPGGPGGDGINAGGTGAVGGPGGAIGAIGELTLTRCSCASNNAGWGGNGGTGYTGLGGSGGSGGSGGAVYAAAALRLNECTLDGNSAGLGGQGGNVPDPRLFPYGPGGGGLGGSGGALYCLSNSAATKCTFNVNQAGPAGEPGSAAFNPSFSGQSSSSGSDGGQGGAIFGCGPLKLDACTVSGNQGGNGSAAEPGGSPITAAHTSSAARTSKDLLDANPHPDIIVYTVFGGPGGAGGVGGIYTENSLRMSLCTLSGNIGGAGGGGGLSSGGYMEFLTGGVGGSGGPGAVYCVASNELVLVACTIAANLGGSGGTGGSGELVPDNSGRTGQGSGGAGGVGGIVSTNAATSATAINSIGASNFGGVGGAGGPFPGSSGSVGAPDIQGSFTSLGHNLIGQTSENSGFTNGANGDVVGSGTAPIDPLLGPLANNGGPTDTMALLHGSPALDAGDDALLRPPYSVTKDQRGFPRKSGPHVDIGAFEFQYRGGDASSPASAPALSGASAPGRVTTGYEASGFGAAAAAPCFQFTFGDSTPGATFTVLATTNLSLPLNNWRVLGQPLQIAPGLFQFIDLQASNNPQRFYRVSSP